MKSKLFGNKKSVFFIVFIFVIILLSTGSILISQNLSKIKYQEESLTISQDGILNEWFKESHEEQWIDNYDFQDSTGWVPEYNGDVTDIFANINNEQANFDVIGEQYTTVLISGTPNSTTSQNWFNATNPDIPVYPTQGHLINASGCFASQLWAEHAGTTTNAYQKTSVQWEKVVATPLNMSDYFITNASLEVLVNATAKAYVGCGSGDVWHWEGVETPGDDDMARFIEGDYVRFYVRLSNINKDVNYEVAQYQTVTLGQDGARIADSYDYLNDTIFIAENVNDLIFFLNQVLENGDYQNFYIILGIEFNCEDNCSTDLDEFPEVFIKSCNFSISYEKKINRLTTCSWKYLGNQIDNKGGEVEVLDSKLYFDYKIDKQWPVHLSPNSEIRILVNDKEHSESIKLSEATQIFKSGKENGFELTKLIPAYDTINISIQVFLADNFNLVENYTISIDNVRLILVYNLFFPAVRDTTFLGLLIGAIIVSGLLATYFIYYRRIGRFPIAVRRVRKYSRTLNKLKDPGVPIKTRENAFNKRYQKTIKKSSGVISSKGPSRLDKTKIKIKKKTGDVQTKQLILLLFILLGFFLFPIMITFNQKSAEININLSQSTPSDVFRREPKFVQLIDNSNFSSSNNWTTYLSGDTSDIETNMASGSANYLVDGASGFQEFSENGMSTGWSKIENDDNLPQPGDFAFGSDGVDPTGWYATYNWPDNQPQSLRVQWQKNFTMNVDMSDYEITSASLNMIINGTVQATAMDNGGIDRPGDTLVNNPSNVLQIATGDFARFFLLISDTNKTREFLAAQYQTDALGRDTPIPITTLNNTLITPVNEETLIFYLEQALKYDHQNFSITLGIYIWCEDSGHPGDSDNWQMLLIKNFNLSIGYQKKIDQFNSMSWRYIGNQVDLSNYSVEVKSAKLFFDFKCNPLWDSSRSPNARINLFINNIQHNETLRLSEAGLSFESAKIDGYDVTQLIPNNDKINITIEVLLADEFVLDSPIIISIDNVFLEINYNLLIPVEPTYLFEILFILAVIGAAALTTYIILYQKIFKFPKQVRKVRKYRKSLNKTNAPDVPIMTQESSFKKLYDDELKKSTKFIKGTPSEKISKVETISK